MRPSVQDQANREAPTTESPRSPAQ